jgi:hypothetical protein
MKATSHETLQPTPNALSSFFSPSTIAFGFSNKVSIGASKFRKSHQNISPAAEPEKGKQ